MTSRQEKAIMAARSLIKSMRYALDDVMYGNITEDRLSDNEFAKIREAYDLICKANDVLP